MDRINELLTKYPEPWVIEKEPHNYNDGTKEFTHVRYQKQNGTSIEIGSHVTPDLAELLILLRTNADILSGAGWRTDWDNAPRDGEEILIGGWGNLGGDGGPIPCSVIAEWDVEDVGGDGGWVTSDNQIRIEEYAFLPEFWMPIPKLPQSHR